MADSIQNTLVVIGPKNILEELVSLVIVKTDKGEDWFDFNKVFPYPKRFADMDTKTTEWEKMLELADKNGEVPPLGPDKGGTSFGEVTPARRKWFDDHPRPESGFSHGGINWNIAHWGTKWNSYNTKKVGKPQRKEKGGEAFVVKMRFQTAWEPPIPIVYGLAAIFPELEFELNYRMEYHEEPSTTISVRGPSRMEFTGSIYPQNSLFR